MHRGAGHRRLFNRFNIIVGDSVITVQAFHVDCSNDQTLKTLQDMKQLRTLGRRLNEYKISVKASVLRTGSEWMAIDSIAIVVRDERI